MDPAAGMAGYDSAGVISRQGTDIVVSHSAVDGGIDHSQIPDNGLLFQKPEQADVFSSFAQGTAVKIFDDMTVALKYAGKSAPIAGLRSKARKARVQRIVGIVDDVAGRVSRLPPAHNPIAIGKVQILHELVAAEGNCGIRIAVITCLRLGCGRTLAASRVARSIIDLIGIARTREVCSGSCSACRDC